MKIVYFTHSLVSCWNHGNAHFLRGVVRALMALGHDVEVYEPAEGWSRENMRRDGGIAAEALFAECFPGMPSRVYDDVFEAELAVDGADVVLVHEWNDPGLIAALGALRRRGAGFALLFHDTHHRGVSDPAALRRLPLDDYDAILAFGAALAEVYRAWGWGDRVFVWHEAADIALFHPPALEGKRTGAVWIGNWGDEERSQELHDYLFAPCREAALELDVFGVRYPVEAVRALAAQGARYHGWLANARAPEQFHRHLLTVHVPRRFYVERLPGIPTIRVFEALACGIPLLCAPWRDSENLFRPGEDFLVAQSPAAMRGLLRDVREDAGLRAALTASGLATIRARHTCAHRVDELLAIVRALQPAAVA